MSTVIEQLSAWGYATPEAALDAAHKANRSLIESRRGQRTRVPVPRPLPQLTDYSTSAAVAEEVYVVADFWWQYLYTGDVGNERLVGRIHGTDAEKVF